ncbi:hypothetical protein GCM10009846_29270 [Agrococcus versicolor]|uniref:Gram-positive cocci surface proteins LPxTG domain-containing protein n=1 Tax=Agrococcus versicolor TaxID=501482 RepID=A0ABP5MNN9_9MICO
MSRRIRPAITAALATAALLATTLVAPALAPAAAASAAEPRPAVETLVAAGPQGAIAIGAEASLPASVLLGEVVPLTLTATNGTGTDAYNLSFRAILPAGSTGVASTSPSDPAPVVTTLADGRVLAVWTNVADLVRGASVSLEATFQAPATATIGSTVGVEIAAAASTNPRTLARFDAQGQPQLNDTTGANTDDASTTIAAFEVSKSEPSAEAELLRGAQDHATVYTITVRNNLTVPTTGLSVVDHLPAGLEFLGCGTVDASPADTEEYPGSGRMVGVGATANPCIEPTSVTTVDTDPDGEGPLAAGVYTRVEWSAQALAASGVGSSVGARSELRFDYVAAIPLRQNVVAELDVHTANLANNTGALTVDEQSLVNGVSATGTTLGAARTVSSTYTVSAEDVSIHKSVRSGDEVTSQGTLSQWGLLVESSEYALSTGEITVVDTLPTSLEYVSSTVQPVEVVVLGDGTQRITWVLPGFTTPDASTVIEYTARTLADYRDAGPIAANDGWTNAVELSTTATVITANDGTTSQLPILDASSAGQTTGTVTLSKDVSDAPAAGGSLDCASAAWSPEVAAGAFAVGDRVCWRVTATFPSRLDTLDVVVRDFLPAGFAFEGVAYTGSIVPNESAFVVDGQTLTWDLADVPDAAQGEVFQVVISTTVTGETGLASDDLVANLAKLAYRNTDGDVLQLRDDASATFAAPLVTLDKSTTATVVNGGDVVPYTVTIRNAGGVDVTGLSVRDLLPTGIGCEAVSVDGATCTVVGGRAQLQWDDLAIAAGGSLALPYTVRIPDTYAPSTALTNTAGVRQYVTTSNVGASTTHVPASNVDTTLTPTAGTPAARDDARVTIDAPTVTKSNTTSVTEAGNALANQATIGEVVTYTVTVVVPEGTTMQRGFVVDAMSAPNTGYTILDRSGTLNGGPLLETMSVTGGVNDGRIELGQTYTNPAGSGDDVLVLTMRVRIDDVAANVHGRTIGNSATVTWYPQGGTTAVSGPRATNSVRIVEPSLSIRKGHDDADGVVSPGQQLTYTVTPANATNRSTAHDLQVVDTLPVDLTPLDAANRPVVGDATLPGGGAWDESARTITWTIASLAPGASQPLSYRVVVASPLTAGTTLRNTVAVTGTSLSGVVAGERTSASTAGGYAGTNGIQVVPANPTIAKTALTPSATIGQTVEYQVVVTIPANTQTFDTTVLDRLPAGIVYDRFVSATGPIAVDPLSEQGDTGTIGFFLGDLQAVPTERVVTIRYAGYVASPAASGQTVTNTAAVHFDTTDRVAGTPEGVPAAGSFDAATPSSPANVGIVAPVLVLDKDVVGQVGDADTRRAKPGETLQYTIAVTNTGTSPAYDVAALDSIDARLEGYVDATDLTQAGDIDRVDEDMADGTLVWQIAGPIAPGQTVTIAYSVVVPSAWDESQEVDGAEVVNTAEASGYGLPLDSRMDADQRVHPVYEAADDVVEVEVDLASIGDTVWYDVDGDGVIDEGEPLLAGVTVIVTRQGGGEPARTVVTDEQGRYLVEHLPGGTYDVRIDRASPVLATNGLVPSFDGDGSAADGILAVVLDEDEAHRDADVGVRGAGSLGDLVWFDQDRDFVQDEGEAGIPGATVTVVWAGLDGDLGTADDVTRTTTTDEAGAWSMTGVPAGDVRVRVALPAALDSYGPVTELDSTVDGETTIVLGAAERRVDLDFGYAGTGSLGDRVWLDRDGDGVDDAGEPGLEGVVLELVLTGPAGEVSTFRTTTDADGAYGFANLPAGSYVVRVVGPLPEGIANTFDPDAEEDADGDSQAAGSIGDGETLDDVDFGFFADVVLGDRVWLDLDGDGVQDAGEPGIEGVTLRADGPNGLSFTTVTDADGGYLFAQVVQGSWTVTVTGGLPAGVQQTFDADGLASSGASTVTLDGAGSLAQDFGYVGTGSIGDLVWLDRDGDGAQGVDEPGLEGVVVTLTWQREGFEDVVLTTTTAADGSYGFAGLPAGTFVVAVDAESLPAGVTPTWDVDGQSVEDADGSATIELGAGGSRTDVDFGFGGSASIGDLVWLDLDADGERSEAEHGLEGVRVLLTWEGEDGELGTADDEVFSTTTDASGAYGFAGLPAGDYVVAVDLATLQAGLLPTYAESGVALGVANVALETGEAHATADFGFRGAGSIGDLVWLDLDADGAQGTTEPGVPAQPVQLTWAGRDGVLGTADDLVFAATTDASGAYRVDGLPDGAFSVTIVGGIADRAANVTDPDDGDPSTALVALGDTGRERLDVDFGYQGLNALGDAIWWDDDANGVDDEGEPRLVGVSTVVTWLGPDGELGTADDVVIPTLPTDADGRYGATGLPDGTYVVAVADGVPAGLAPSVDAGVVEGADGVATVELVSADGVGVEDLAVDFGFAGSGVLGDLVWLDLDGDGERGDGEPGLEGVTVTVTWHGVDGEPGTGDERTWTTTVGDDGAWSVGGLPAGSFDVVLTGVPAGLVPSADPDGGDDSRAVTTLEPGQTRDELDFGFVGGASVGDTVWLEVDGDGAQSALEPGVPGVAVTVVSAGVDGILGTDDDLAVVVTTDADGRYLVEGLPTGPTLVSYDPESLPAGTAPFGGALEEPVTSVEIVLADGDARDDVDFPVVGTQTLEGVVWVDGDGDGVRDDDEPGIPDVTVVVTWQGPLGPIELTVVTDANGAWTLPNVPAGDWSVRIDLDTVPPHLVGSTPAEVVVQVPVDGVGSVEHGLVPTGSVGDVVFHDEDRDGVQDAGERGLGGVTVQLLDAQGRVVAETVTAEDGSYLFEDVAPGRYTVRIDMATAPAGYVVTTGDESVAVEVGPGESVLTADFPLAAPVVAPAPIPGVDLPRTGGELPLALLGVTLLLLLAGAVLLLVRRRRA